MVGSAIGFGVAGFSIDAAQAALSPYMLMPGLVAFFGAQYIDNITMGAVKKISKWISVPLDTLVAALTAAAMLYYNNRTWDMKLGIVALASGMGYAVGKMI